MIKVLIVDDSAIVRKVMSDELSKYNDIEIIGTAVDPYVARDKIVKLKPDVITLDLEMPRMDGLTFLAKLMKHYPMPVVVLSSLTPKNSETALKALDLGAIDVLCKPGEAYSTKNVSQNLARSIRMAAASEIDIKQIKVKIPVNNKNLKGLLTKTTHKVVAIGASTGGTKAIEAILSSMPATTPGTVIVQHMPENFTKSFSERLNELSQMEVREAKDNDHVVPGVALIAPGNNHMVLNRNGGVYIVKLKKGPRVHYQRPSVEVLFQSVAKNVGKNAVGVMLTGMGSDGAKGMLAMKKRGAYTMAQDEKSCVVFGMPKEAIKIGAASEVVSLENVPQTIFKALKKNNASGSHGKH
jgi:two-component system chemotaxis response regulator CheB